jgi:hypothetical protein
MYIEESERSICKRIEEYLDLTKRQYSEGGE